MQMGLKNQMWQVIEWTDDSNDTLVYRYPHQGKEIISGSQLTVRESQVAVFVHLGQIADIFAPGKYKLETKNLPILSGLGSLFYQGRESRFKAEVYFVNTKQFTNQKWGTSSPIPLRDPDFGVIRIKAFGTYSFKVHDAGVFMKELFGTNSTFTVDNINNYLKSMLLSSVTDTIAESKVSALELSANLNEFNGMASNNVRESLTNRLESPTLIESISFLKLWKTLSTNVSPWNSWRQDGYIHSQKGGRRIGRRSKESRRSGWNVRRNGNWRKRRRRTWFDFFQLYQR